MEKYLIAHDLGTSGNKATLFSVDGKMKKCVTASYPVLYSDGNRAEQDPEDWWQAICSATKRLLDDIDPKEVTAISFSGQMMGCVCVDKDGNALRNAIIWADTRSDKQEQDLAANIAPERLYRLAGHKLSSSYSLEKLMWVRDNEPLVFEKTYKLLQSKDYIVCRMTGEFMTDYSDGSGTNALDLNTLTWSDEILSAADIDKSLFPELFPSTTVVGTVSKAVSAECGLAEGTKIVLGGGDGSCASVGAGSVSEGITYSCVGSSSWISTVSKAPYFDDKMRTVTWAHVIPGLLIPSGTMQTAAVAFEWGINHFCQAEMQVAAKNKDNSLYDVINRNIATSKAGSNALIFLPYLLGERCPRWNSNACASFIGLKNDHSTSDMMRSIVEGIAMNLDIIIGILRNAVDIKEILIVGGMAQGEIVQQILADVFEMDIVRLKHLGEATAIGAAVIAGIGAGELSGFSDYEKFNQIQTRKQPICENFEIYRNLKELFELSYQSQLPLYEKLAKL